MENCKFWGQVDEFSMQNSEQGETSETADKNFKIGYTKIGTKKVLKINQKLG